MTSTVEQELIPHATTAWVVRAGSQGEAEASNLALGRASIGWSEVPDMSAMASREQIREIVDGLYPGASSQSRAVTTGQLWAFRSVHGHRNLLVGGQLISSLAVT